MNDQDKKLVIDLALNKVSEKYFFMEFSIDIKNNKNYLISLLQQADSQKNGDIIECCLILYKKFGSRSDIIPFLNQLIIEDWHFKHEDIARFLQKQNNSNSAKFLFKASSMKLGYLDYNNSESLARKCIYALGAIDNEDSRKYLVDIANSDDEVVSEYAKHQLKKIGYSDLIPI